MLSAQAGNVKQFPWHHDVRFAQHELQLVNAVLNNLPACIKVWEQMQAPESTSDRKEKAEAKVFSENLEPPTEVDHLTDENKCNTCKQNKQLGKHLHLNIFCMAYVKIIFSMLR